MADQARAAVMPDGDRGSWMDGSGFIPAEESPLATVSVAAPLDKGGEEPPTPLGNRAEDPAAPLDEGGEESAQATLSIAAPLDNGG